MRNLSGPTADRHFISCMDTMISEVVKVLSEFICRESIWFTSKMSMSVESLKAQVYCFCSTSAELWWSTLSSCWCTISYYSIFVISLASCWSMLLPSISGPTGVLICIWMGNSSVLFDFSDWLLHNGGGCSISVCKLNLFQLQPFYGCWMWTLHKEVF